MNCFPADPKKLRARLRSYERKLKLPHHDDGAGKRFLMGTMYLLLNDPQGAIAYYDWYQQHFPDDAVEPLNHLSWALALKREGNISDANDKLVNATLTNPHVLDWIEQKPLKRLDIWYGCNWSEPEYLGEVPVDISPEDGWTRES